jgi:hypothetical protein
MNSISKNKNISLWRHRLIKSAAADGGMGAICGGPGGVARTSRMQLGGGGVFFLWLCWLYGGCKDEMPAATKNLFE